MPDGLTNTFYANDLVASQTLDTNKQDWTLDPRHRFRSFTTSTLVDGSWVNATSKLNHYGDDSDSPRWIIEDATLGSLTRMVSGPDGTLAATTSATGDVQLQIVNLHSDVAATVDATLMPDSFNRFDEFGVPASGQAAGRYGWLGGAQRSAEALGGVILMGVRLYHTDTGRFLQTDPVDGGSATTYDYCNADPVNCTDLAGTWPNWSAIKKAVTVVAKVAEIASMIPGPIGTIAGVVSAVSYAATGNWQAAAWAIGGAAAAMIGAGAAVKAAKIAVTTIRASRATKAAAAAGKATRSCNSFAPDTPVLMADGNYRPIADVHVGDYVVSVAPATGERSAKPVLDVSVGQGTKHLIGIDLDGDTSTMLTATAEHPIWVVGRAWVDARMLVRGDQLLASDGTRATVRGVRERGFQHQTVYNLNVGDIHTYVVSVDSHEVLVHNKSTCVIGSGSVGKSDRLLSMVDAVSCQDMRGDGFARRCWPKVYQKPSRLPARTPQDSRAR